MKQKRKYHEISDEECDATASTPKTKGGNKRLKMSQSVMLNQIDPEEEEVWLMRLPAHLNPDNLYDKKV